LTRYEFPKAVIDTGPLFDALVLNYGLAYGLQPKFASVLDEVLQTGTSQRQFLRLIASIREKLTTSHVIAELYGLEIRLLKLKPPNLSVFLRDSIDLLRYWGIDEKLVRLLDLALNDGLSTRLPEIGVTDTGLIDLASRHGCVLITRDARTLYIEAHRHHVDCRLVNQLVLYA